MVDKIIFEGKNWKCPSCNSNDLIGSTTQFCKCGFDRNSSDNADDHYTAGDQTNNAGFSQQLDIEIVRMIVANKFRR